jgi:hypothetical protein
VVEITERGERESCLGRVVQLKVWAPGYPPLSWRQIWDAFVKKYPGKWAVQVFPPADRLVDSKAVYHLWVMEGVPAGLDLR